MVVRRRVEQSSIQRLFRNFGDCNVDPGDVFSIVKSNVLGQRRSGFACTFATENDPVVAILRLTNWRQCLRATGLLLGEIGIPAVNLIFLVYLGTSVC